MKKKCIGWSRRVRVQMICPKHHQDEVWWFRQRQNIWRQLVSWFDNADRKNELAIWDNWWRILKRWQQRVGITWDSKNSSVGRITPTCTKTKSAQNQRWINDGSPSILSRRSYRKCQRPWTSRLQEKKIQINVLLQVLRNWLNGLLENQTNEAEVELKKYLLCHHDKSTTFLEEACTRKWSS